MMNYGVYILTSCATVARNTCQALRVALKFFESLIVDQIYTRPFTCSSSSSALVLLMSQFAIWKFRSDRRIPTTHTQQSSDFVNLDSYS